MISEQKIPFRTILKYNLYFWSVWWVFYAILFSHNTGLLMIFSMFYSLLSVIPLFLLSLLLWPICRKLKFTRTPKILFILIHLVGANLYTVLWLALNFGSIYLIYGYMLRHMFDVWNTMGWQYPSGITFYLMVTGGYYSLIYYQEIKLRERKEVQLQLLLRDAQLNALKNQMNPHFLFNSLNSINALITAHPEKARSMLVRLSDLLRLSLTTQTRAFVPLHTELEFAHSYLEIEKIRLGKRLSYSEQVADDLRDAEVPVMILQPLLENAIKHGIAPSTRRGSVRLQIEDSLSGLVIQVQNSVAEGVLGEGNGTSTGNGVGLENLKKRLSTIYGNNFRMEHGWLPDGNFRVTIEIPLKPDR